MSFINEPDHDFVQDPMSSVGLGGGLIMLQHEPDIAVQLDSENLDYGWIFKKDETTQSWQKLKESMKMS